MPIIYSPDQLSVGDVPHVAALHAAPILIHDALSAMYKAGDIVAATSYGSMFMPSAHITCASDVDWLIIFTDTKRMFRSEHWRVLLHELERQHMHFGVPALTLQQIQTGNHTLCSLLHGIRSTTQRLTMGEDPIKIFARYGAHQNTYQTTLQLFSSFTRFFFENYAHMYSRQMPTSWLVRMLNEAVSIWKDIVSTMLVQLIPENKTIAVTWSVYEQLYKRQVAKDVMQSGALVAEFLQDLRETMIAYDVLRQSGNPREDFAQDYGVFLEESRHVIEAAAHFADANIALYRSSFVQHRTGKSSHSMYKAYNNA